MPLVMCVHLFVLSDGEHKAESQLPLSVKRAAAQPLPQQAGA